MTTYATTRLTHSTTNECSVGIDEPKGTHVNKWCTIDGYQDLLLEPWVKSDRSVIPIQIKRTNKSTAIFSANHSIVVKNNTYRCPEWPIYLDRYKNFTLITVSHVSRVSSLSNAGQGVLKVTMRQLNDTPDEDLSWVDHLKRMEFLENLTVFQSWIELC